LEGQSEALNRSDQCKQRIVIACGDRFCIGHGRGVHLGEVVAGGRGGDLLL
jgi:hypothetical protein